jgi:large subunit ribosomal protein L35
VARAVSMKRRALLGPSCPLPKPPFCPYKRRFDPPGQLGLPWRVVSLVQETKGRKAAARQVERSYAARLRESKMPKLKTKSGAKKRFKITGTGKVVYAQRGKRHGMIKRTNKQIRNLRGTNVMFKTDGDNVKKYFLPNG